MELVSCRAFFWQASLRRALQSGLLAMGLCLLIAGCHTPVEISDAESRLTPPTPADSTEPGAPDPHRKAQATEAIEAVEPLAIRPFPGVVVFPDGPAVEIEAHSCLKNGWLEQIACSPNTREYEALLVVETAPQQIHASLLMAGFQPGSPGSWAWEGDVVSFTPPTGDALDVLVRYAGPSGETIEEPVRNWIADHLGQASFPAEPWIFAGSRFAPNPPRMGPGEHYVADMTGSIIGLVTFGDEVIGFSRVLSGDSAVQSPEWEVATDRVPPLGTPVTLILRPFERPPLITSPKLQPEE